jgi:hypothetical protein
VTQGIVTEDLFTEEIMEFVAGGDGGVVAEKTTERLRWRRPQREWLSRPLCCDSRDMLRISGKMRFTYILIEEVLTKETMTEEIETKKIL